MTQQTITLNGSKLREIAHANPTAIVTMTALAMRERLRHVSDIPRTKNHLKRQGEKIVDADYMKLWKDLEAAGVGSIIYGRRNVPDRFEWHYSLKKVAKAAIEGTNELVEKLDTNQKGNVIDMPKKKQSRPKLSEAEKSQRAKQAEEVKTASGEKLVYIQLRDNYDLELKLPMDLNKDDVEIITRALNRHSA